MSLGNDTNAHVVDTATLQADATLEDRRSVKLLWMNISRRG